MFGDIHALMMLAPAHSQPNSSFFFTDGTEMDGSADADSKVTIEDKFYGAH